MCFLRPTEYCIPNREVLLFLRRIRVLVQNKKMKNFQAANLVLIKHASLLEKEDDEGNLKQVYELVLVSHLPPAHPSAHSPSVTGLESFSG